MSQLFIRLSETTPGVFHTLETVADRYEPTYPFDSTSPPKKTVIDVHTVDENTAYQQILSDITQIQSLDLVNAYLYAVAKHLKITVTKEWKSYQIVIAKTNTVVTPQSILQKTTPKTPGPSVVKNPPPRTPAEHLTMATYLMSGL